MMLLLKKERKTKRGRGIIAKNAPMIKSYQTKFGLSRKIWLMNANSQNSA